MADIGLVSGRDADIGAASRCPLKAIVVEGSGVGTDETLQCLALQQDPELSMTRSLKTILSHSKMKTLF
jgi:hypothetical protein